MTALYAASWNRLVREGLIVDGAVNVRYSFAKMCKRYGQAYIDYLRAAWAARGDLPESEFCRLNGGVPVSFLSKLL